MLYRAYKDYDSSIVEIDQIRNNKILLLSSVIVLMASFFCLLIDTSWTRKEYLVMKIYQYTIIAEALCFSIVFG